MSNLHSQLASLASSFANAVLEAIRGASLEDLLSESRAPSKARREQPNGTPRPARARSSGRLKRRSPEDIAGAALLLASKAGAFITGQTLVVDGGTMIT